VALTIKSARVFGAESDAALWTLRPAPPIDRRKEHALSFDQLKPDGMHKCGALHEVDTETEDAGLRLEYLRDVWKLNVVNGRSHRIEHVGFGITDCLVGRHLGKFFPA
jgi:hypothetical protein